MQAGRGRGGCRFLLPLDKAALPRRHARLELGQWSPDGYFGIERGKNFSTSPVSKISIQEHPSALTTATMSSRLTRSPGLTSHRPRYRFHIRAQAGHPELDHDASSRRPRAALAAATMAGTAGSPQFRDDGVWRGHLFAAHTTDRCIELRNDCQRCACQSADICCCTSPRRR